jgi:acetate---CoA ligase (ADP-forming)
VSAAGQLEALLAPASVAVYGASGRPGRPGHRVLTALQATGGPSIYPVTDRYAEVLGLPCVAVAAELPEPVDLAIIASAATRIEADAEAAIATGARSLLVFGAIVGPERDAWAARLANRACNAGVPLLGPDSLGYVNFASRSSATWAVPHVEAGSVAVISQSGTMFWEAVTNDPRLGISLAAHTGLEATLTVAELMRYAMAIEATRVLGIYIETVRDVDGFVAALEQAERLDIPVVALYAGATESAREQMTTHAGRMAGNHAAFEAVFARHGVARTRTPDEWWTTLALLAGDRRMAAGGLAAVMDSGGGMAMFLDQADEVGVPLAQVSHHTRHRIGGALGLEGPGANPVDFWSGGGLTDLESGTAELIDLLAADPETAAIMVFTTFGGPAGAGFAPEVAAGCRVAAARTNKPVLAATYSSRQMFPDLLRGLHADGIPTLDGVRAALVAVRHALDRRDFRDHNGAEAALVPSARDQEVAQWLTVARGPATLMEREALAMLEVAGVATVPTVAADSAQDALAAAQQLGYPVVLKTDEGIAHKADRGGVHLGLVDATAMADAYRKLAESLGPRVIVAPMLNGLEVALGIVTSQFGPMLMVSAGGGLIEVLDDRRYLLAPVSAHQVRTVLGQLAIGRLLLRRLGEECAGVQALCQAAARLSEIAAALGPRLSELDVNPILVSSDGAIAVDALVALTADRDAAITTTHEGRIQPARR